MEEKNLLEGLQELVVGLLKQVNARIIECEIFKYKGFSKLEAKYNEHLEEEMKYLKEAVSHIIKLKGTANLNIAESRETSLKDANECKIYEDPVEYLKSEFEKSKNGLCWLKELIKKAEGKYSTYCFLVEYYKDEEQDMEWTKCQLELIKTIGKENWLINQI